MRIKFFIISLLVAAFSPCASAAELTDILSSFDFDRGNPFDISLKINYSYESQSSNLLREAVEGGEIIMANSLAYDRSIHTMNFDLGIGLYHDIEFRLDIPLVLSESSSLGIHSGIVASDKYQYISTIDPSEDPWNFNNSTKASTMFDVPFSGPSRSGLGDIGLGIRWAPRHFSREPKHASWVIGAMLRLPTGTVRRAGNSGVGEGLYQIEVNTAISRRVTPFFEPFFDLHGVVKIPSGSSLFDELDESTQTLVQPGNSMGLTVGTEFIPWEVEGGKRKVSIELGFGLDYVFEGREYTELFDALGTSYCQVADGNDQDLDCLKTTYTGQLRAYEDQLSALNKQKNKAATQQEKDQIQAQYDTLNTEYLLRMAAGGTPWDRSDGITDVEHYGMYSFYAAVNAKPIEYLSLGVRFQLVNVQPHFITFADAGKNLDDDGVVTGYNSDGLNEYNPKYIEEIDQVGKRFKTTDKINWSLSFNITGMF